MEKLIKILKENEIVENLNCFEDITSLISENNLKEEIKSDFKLIEIENKKYYIIVLTCDYCGEKFFYIADEKSANIGEIKSYYDFESSNDYDVLCNNCVENYFYHCDYCGELIGENEGVWCEDDSCLYCESCAEEFTFTCEDCGEVHSIDRRIITGDNQEICENCYNNGNYGYCENCEEIYSYDNLNYVEGNEAYYCNDCFADCCDCQFDYENAENRENENITRPLQNYDDKKAVCQYHHNPIDFIKRTSILNNSNNNLFLGVELEVSTSNSQIVNRASSFVADNLYCRIEEDSSIPDHGFEIISDPMTIEKWQERKNKIEQVFQELINNDFVSHNARGGNCGLHIHASREALGDTEAEREETINNIILITENFKKELQQFSRRTDFGWCHFFNDDTENNGETNINKIKENKGNKGRYQVINTTNNNTIEFRLCRGTLKTNTFFASLQLFYNIIQLAKSKNFLQKGWATLIKMNNFKELQEYNKKRQIKSTSRIKETSKKEEQAKKQNQNLYETIVIFNCSALIETEIENIQKEIGKYGKFVKHERIGVKNLAYALQGKTQGFYYYVNFKMKFDNIRKYEKIFKNNNNVLKFLTYKKEEA